MRAALALAALLVATPAQALPWECVLWPKRCQAPAPVQMIPAPEPPAAAEPSTVAPPTPPAAVTEVPSWCRYVPAGTTLKRFVAAHKKTMTPEFRRHAQACFASKKG